MKKDNPKDFSEEVRKKEARKVQARKEGDRSVWFGLGMFGLVGWSVAIPTLGGIAIGIWIDKTWPGPRSWTLMCLVIGVIIGCVNAWYWVKRESGRE
ncbi:MAG: AtpZ/AtpI family protein [Deltaproteobacteria bacterium]|jgi:ATP synthase protein I|nr:AtpZ/AtpI family protein [Deltaproteobacteria bacterium]